MSDKDFIKENEKLDKHIEKLLADNDKNIENYEKVLAAREQEFEKNVIKPIENYCREMNEAYKKSDEKWAKITGNNGDED